MKWESKGKRKVFSFKRLGKSFVYAVKGIITAFKTEQNLWVDLLGMIIAIILGIWLKISNMEFCSYHHITNVSFIICILFLLDIFLRFLFRQAKLYYLIIFHNSLVF